MSSKVIAIGDNDRARQYTPESGRTVYGVPPHSSEKLFLPCPEGATAPEPKFYIWDFLPVVTKSV